jgi:hypothetical protein
MHRLFNVDNVLLLIFTYIREDFDDGKPLLAILAILARTCKRFKDASLHLLWRRLDGVLPLFLLLPVDKGVCFAQIALVSLLPLNAPTTASITRSYRTQTRT